MSTVANYWRSKLICEKDKRRTMLSTTSLAMLSVFCLVTPSSASSDHNLQAVRDSKPSLGARFNSCQESPELREDCEICTQVYIFGLDLEHCCRDPVVRDICQVCQHDIYTCLIRAQKWVKNLSERTQGKSDSSRISNLKNLNSNNIPQFNDDTTNNDNDRQRLQKFYESLDKIALLMTDNEETSYPHWSHVSKKWFEHIRFVFFPQGLSYGLLQRNRMYGQKPHSHVLAHMKRLSTLGDKAKPYLNGDVQAGLYEASLADWKRNNRGLEWKSRTSGNQLRDPGRFGKNSLNAQSDEGRQVEQKKWHRGRALTPRKYAIPKVSAHPFAYLMVARKRDGDVLNLSEHRRLLAQLSRLSDVNEFQPSPNEDDSDADKGMGVTYDFFVRLLLFVDALKQAAKYHYNHLAVMAEQDASPGNTSKYSLSKRNPKVSAQVSNDKPSAISHIGQRVLTLELILPRLLNIRHAVTGHSNRSISPQPTTNLPLDLDFDISADNHSEDFNSDGSVDVKDEHTDTSEHSEDVTHDDSDDGNYPDDDDAEYNNWAHTNGLAADNKDKKYQPRSDDKSLEQILNSADTPSAVTWGRFVHKRWGSLGAGKFRQWWVGKIKK